ncbi:hypothetical protein SteCoe_33178 [Stentor coeruleus]|uniref:Septin-type G domain-containing protein n=1 Tax=Stentor coeruleus TaxID=5963 RepID=A0A1R2AXA4_9CILI|nr:hypothetical protein SteCoe_33178 [Stentor coeruleus]
MSFDSKFTHFPNHSISSHNILPKQHLTHRTFSATTLKFPLLKSQPPTPTSTLKKKQQLNLINEALIQRLNKPINYNLLFLGDSNIGKSSFINSILAQHFGITTIKANKQISTIPTRNFIEYTESLYYNDLELKCKLIDTPGYGFFTTKEKWLESIIQIITSKVLDYKNNKHLVPKNQLEDPRIHAAFFMVEGPRCKENDLFLMHYLQKYISIIPIIVKADSYSSNELIQVKGNFICQCAEAGIKFYDIAGGMGDDIGVLSSGDLGPVPPFAVISAGNMIEVDNKVVYVRNYTWGHCDIYDKSCSDFQMFCQILFGKLVVPIVDTAKGLNKSVAKKIKNIEKKAKIQENLNKQTEKIRKFSRFVAHLVLNLI